MADERMARNTRTGLWSSLVPGLRSVELADRKKRGREHSHSARTRPLDSRLEALGILERMIRENIESIYQALFEDLRKPRQESVVSEVAITLEEIALAKKSLRRWLRPEKTKVPLTLWPARSCVYREPLGVVLILGPWSRISLRSLFA